MTQYLKLLLDHPVLIAAIFICGIGGTFPYGYSVSVLTSPSPFIKQLINSTCESRYNLSLDTWQLSLIWSFTVSVFCIGGLVGSLMSASLMAKFGRKGCLLRHNFGVIFGAVLMLLSKTAASFEMIMVGRFVYGFSSGVSLSAHPIYLLECAPKKLKAMMGVTVGTFISGGKFFGQLLGISEFLGTEKAWPWLLGFSGFTALFQLCTLPFLPESPRFLLLDRGDRQACEKALKRLWGNNDYSKEVEEMLQENAAVRNVRNHSALELIQTKTLRWQLITIIVTFCTVQLSGINAAYFYSFDVFHAAGIPDDKLRYAALGMGLCELCASISCFMIIENTGKKVLLFRGYMGMSATLVLLTITLYLQTLDISWMPYCSMVLLFVFIFCFAVGPVGVSSPLPGEIFTQTFKPAAYVIAGIVNWTSLFVVGMVFPILVENLDYFCFLIFLFFCFTCGVYFKLNVPEVKHKTALQITKEFDEMHSKSRKNTTESKADGVEIYETKF
ncbi:solute carrier family 2 member 11, like [Pholidichthys leucotaenia]